MLWWLRGNNCHCKLFTAFSREIHIMSAQEIAIFNSMASMQQEENSSKYQNSHDGQPPKSIINIPDSQGKLYHRVDLFKKSTTLKKDDFFDVGFEDSHICTTDSLSQNSDTKDTTYIFKSHKKIGISKNKAEDAFDIDFEESKEASTQASQGSLQAKSQKSDETCFQDTTINFKKPKLFNNPKLHSINPFDIDFEESGQALTQITQHSQASGTSSQKSTDGLSQGETIRPLLFQDRKRCVSTAFEIDFEESCQHDTLEHSGNAQVGLSLESDKENDDTSINFETRDPFQEAKQRRLNHPFEVDFEESRNITNDLNISHTTPTKTMVVPFRKSSQAPKEDDFDVNFSCTDIEKNVHDLTEGSDQVISSASQIQLQLMTSGNEKSADNLIEEPCDDLNNSSLRQSFNSELGKKKEAVEENYNQLNSNSSRTQSFISGLRKNIEDSMGKSGEVLDKTSQNQSFSLKLRKNSDDLTEKSGQVMNNTSRTQSFIAGLSGMNVTETASNLNQSSFNHDNLDQWISDQSDEELEIGRDVKLATSARKTLPPEDICPPPDIEEEEDHMQQLQFKLKQIIDSARNGKVLDRSPVITNVNREEKPKKVQIKRKTSVKPTTLKKPASFATKRLYNHIITKIRPKFGIDSVIHAEELIINMCDVVKTVLRRKGYQKKLISDLKMEMAKMGVIETTFQFYEFIREFLPYEFRLKSIPCIQPGTNIVYPPRDAVNPFQKIYIEKRPIRPE